ncbi:MAG: CAP domain-containing protein [Bacillota bacterium]
MSKSKRFLIIFTVLCLLLFPVTAFACSSGQSTGTSLENKIVIPVSLQQGGETQRTWVQVPGSTGVRKISITYRIQLRPVPGTPSQPVTPPAPQDPPVTPPLLVNPPVTPPPPPPAATVLTADEQQMWELVNAERTSRGLKALEVHPGLVKLARMKSQDMITNNYFAHQSPTYGSPFDMMRREGITYRYAGENLAGSPTVERAHTALMDSPGHRANILNPNFTHIGIGIVDGGRYGKMFTQMFIGVN